MLGQLEQTVRAEVQNGFALEDYVIYRFGEVV